MVTVVEQLERVEAVEPVLCVVDGSPADSEAVTGAISRCKTSGATLELVAVLRTSHGRADSTAEHVCRVSEAQNALIAAIGAARRAGVPFRVASRCC